MEVPSELWAILQVIFINVVLSGDNAIVVGMAANSAPAEIRSKVIFYGIVGAVVLRVLLALLAVRFLDIVGLLFAGGLVLLWVCWKLFREIRQGAASHAAAEGLGQGDESNPVAQPAKTLGAAMQQIIIADISMSLDNVLAVAGAAREHPWIMAAGLVLSVLLMGAAATIIARLLDRFRWLAWIGLLVIVYVALHMMWEGGWQIEEAVAAMRQAASAALG
jgi:YjbE family integral membrane protein